ncbi:phosphoribosylformylglycinamidine synthase [Granulosicoccus antarcticus]|uniref:Phosphoribosylformylglycinamidine synthase n=1 Tax=Granulosicoccus antarcticus IMCC3135 TaxID=1192854 RepID=A0A2Z2P2U3_9GAMM|nr:phosphoribosylformylglycinamidine synthase [Granulosicoccus antarcticus]ASJ74897.1 Phosphoribosylformylglycinamidine synthase [Granulosicoccus antarcticus IMCC3135]
MLCLSGANALSSFRQEQLLKQLRSVDALFQAVSARYVYFVQLDVANGVPIELDPVHRQRLSTLLLADDHYQAVGAGWQVNAVPRLGTRSAWSSKASDIVGRCGMSAVKRVERGVQYHFEGLDPSSLSAASIHQARQLLHDRMTESLIELPEQQHLLFEIAPPAPLITVPVLEGGKAALEAHNQQMGLALSSDELDYLEANFSRLQRDPSDAELMMFAQANSEHCRHKIFNANWTLDGKVQEQSLFDMIRHTYKSSPDGVLSAYHDNAAVIEGHTAHRWLAGADGAYQSYEEPVHIQIKVETHNHPTAISPFPGAATGSGGEIRDEGAVGNGSKPKAGLCGFTVSNLNIPNWSQPWEIENDKPDRLASAFEIMQAGPIGAAAFNNEFGRPNLTGYFRTYCQSVPVAGAAASVSEIRGYHKPIMIAGGMGSIRAGNIEKQAVPAGADIVVLGGPSMLIGLGGGAASSVASGAGDSELDFASVQRGNPEMQRRCQEVIDRCIALGDASPVLSVHDVGAGGLSNALPELVNDAARGGAFELRSILNDEPGMSPMAIWSNESQERYVLAIISERLPLFESLCQRERCLYAVVGKATEERVLRVSDAEFDNFPVDMPLDVLLGKPPKLEINATHRPGASDDLDTATMDIEDVVGRVLQLPAVAAKNFLITIGDRSITGQVVRDQLVGPWQMPVADVAVTVADFRGYTGEAMAMGERSPIAVLDAAASARMAVAESLTNIVAADIGQVSDVKLSANWMAASGYPGEDAALFDAVQAVGLELAPALGIAIPVGKDSLSMRTVWQDEAGDHSVTAPMSLVVTAFAAVNDVRKTLTPQLREDCGETDLLLIDLGAGKNRLGGSALAQVYGKVGSTAPDVDDPLLLKGLFNALQELIRAELVLAWHDRSDGGLFVTLAEMGFAGNCGIKVNLNSLPSDAIASLFNEELGGVLQVRRDQFAQVMAIFDAHGLSELVHALGEPTDSNELQIWQGSVLLMSETIQELRIQWWQTSYHMQRLRDNPDSADEELEHISRDDDPGISPRLSFDPASSLIEAAPQLLLTRPSVAILREQGVNGHFEMAAAFERAGFNAVDVHMSDLFEGRHDLASFKGLVACGGFSFGDVLGAGGGWANSVLFSEQLSAMFRNYFERDDTFSLGVCNGCQMMSRLKSLIPGTDNWPRFERNESEQFEARVATVEIYESPSLFLTDMVGSRLPVALAHGEGRVVFDQIEQAQVASVCLGYVDNQGAMTETYPLNPNGSPFGVTGLCNDDGRVTIMMPHPERVFRTVTNSWAPPAWGENGPWLRMFENARVWVG